MTVTVPFVPAARSFVTRGGVLLALISGLVACGGGGGGNTPSTTAQTGSDAPLSAGNGVVSDGSVSPAAAAAAAAAASTDAFRFLTQATFGPSDAEVQRVVAMGYDAWLNEQLAPTLLPSRTHKTILELRDRDYQYDAGSSSVRAPLTDIPNGFLTQALTEQPQLKQRLVLAWSEIMVASLADSYLGHEKNKFAGYVDVLTANCCGKYKDLLAAVAKTPAMGHYLTYLRNQKEDSKTGRTPDENFAREIMQLFSIGLYKLNMDGTLYLDPVTKKPVETYTQADIQGLAKVFTGFALDHSSGARNWNCFWSNSSCREETASAFKPMVGYSTFHSTSEKVFLGTTIAAQTTADPEASFQAAIAAIASHPNVAPFISKQLIQRLVTSNPSAAYVRDVATAFKNSDGDINATVRAILLHSEARSATTRALSGYGKVREPVLRMTALLRAFSHTSDTFTASASPKETFSPSRLKYYDIGWTSNPGTSLAQMSFFSPSVFNFFRPGYVPPAGTATATAGKVAPELQIHSESAEVGYVNWVMEAVQYGIGAFKVYDADGKCGVVKVADVAYPNCPVDTAQRRDVQFSFVAERTAAATPATLVTLVAKRLMGGVISSSLRTAVETAVASIDIANAAGSAKDALLDNRTRAAIFLIMISPEFIVQK